MHANAAAGTVIVEATVPWMFSQSGTYLQWLWATRDFTATVVCDAGAWSWAVKSASSIPVGSGVGDGFDTCADLVLEAIGKGFGDGAGYARWTRGASHRYVLASGVRTDLSDGAGKVVRITLSSGLTVDGVLHLGDWLLHLVDDGVQHDVNPAFVTRIDRLP